VYAIDKTAAAAQRVHLYTLPRDCSSATESGIPDALPSSELLQHRDASVRVGRRIKSAGLEQWAQPALPATPRLPLGL
jgi:hypothetical protein